MDAAVRRFEESRPATPPEGDAQYREVLSRSYTMCIDLLEGARDAVNDGDMATAATLGAQCANTLDSTTTPPGGH